MTEIGSLSDEWKDDERMRVLFAPMRNKELNPESWNAKLTFWTTLIEKWCLKNNKHSFTLHQLEAAFTRDGISPHCLSEVLTQSTKSGKIVDTNRYKSQLVAAGSWGSWAKNLGWRAVQSVGDSVLGHNPDSFTIPEVAEKLMDKLMTILRSKPPQFVKNNFSFVESRSIDCLKSEDWKHTLKLLRLKNLVDTCELESGLFIKLKKSGSTENVKFDDSDICILKLKLTIDNLEKETETLEDECRKLGDKVKQLLKSDSRASAKSTLKRQKLLEQNLQKKLDQKLNLETLLDEILNTDSNKTIVNSYKTGVDELKSKLKDLNAENVEDILADLNEVLAEGDQLSDTLSRYVLEDSFDADDLEKELQNLSNQESDLDVSKELQKSLSEDDKKLLEALEQLEVNDLEPQINEVKEENKIAVAL